LAPIAKNVLAPGDSTVVELIIKGNSIKYKKTVSADISSNDALAAKIRIRFSAAALPDTDTVSTVFFSPKILEFGEEHRRQKITVKNYEDLSALALMPVGYVMDAISIDYPSKPLKSGGKDEIKLTWKGEIPEYDVERSLTFDTGSDSLPRFSIPYVIKGIKGPQPGKGGHQAQTAAPRPPTTKPTQAITTQGRPGAAIKKPVQRPAGTKTEQPATGTKTEQPATGTKTDQTAKENPIDEPLWPPN
jgi:hypothetical protein